MKKEISTTDLSNFLAKEKVHLEEITKAINRFNPFEVLGVGNFEIRHSNVIGWLLDPNGNHGAGSYFLDAMVSDLDMDDLDDSLKTDILLSPHKTTFSYRERDNIDIEVVNELENWSIVIENKFYAGLSGDDQLQKYRDRKLPTQNKAENEQQQRDDEREEKGLRHVFVFLSPYPFNLDDVKGGEHYRPLLYEQIISYIENALNHFELHNEIELFLTQYINHLKLKGMTTENNKTLEIAHRIYLENKESLDYIINHKPSIYSEKNFKYVNSYFNDEKEESKYIRITPKNKNIIRILPRKIADRYKGFKGWGKDYMFAIELFLKGERLWVKFCLAHAHTETDQQFKDKIYEEFKASSALKNLFASRSQSDKKYTGVATDTIMHITDDEFVNGFEAHFKSAWDTFEKAYLDSWVDEVLNIEAVNNG